MQYSFLCDNQPNKLCSDEAVSKYLEESGGCLTELSLNNVGKVLCPDFLSAAQLCVSC
jgi:hypothetical protein